MMAVQPFLSMPMLSDLLAEYLAAPLLHDVEIRGLSVDSRQVKPGDLFFALQGMQEHGLQYLEQALAHGAVAVVWEKTQDSGLLALMQQCRVPNYALNNLSQQMGCIASEFYKHPSRHMHCMGVTGTDGKTSVAHFIAQALHTEQSPCGLLGTLGYGVLGALQEPTHTTPHALRLQAELANIRNQHAHHLVMEVSSHALDQYRVAGIEFDTAVLTNLSREHLDYHGSMDRYAAAKRRLFQWRDLKTVVLNLDDAFGESLLAEVAQDKRVIAYSINPQFKPAAGYEWLYARHIERLPRGMRIVVASSWGEVVFETGLLGDFNVANLLAAAAALLASGLSFEALSHCLSKLVTAPGRMEMLGELHKPLVVIDYAHTPNALRNALIALRQHCAGQLICVFGAGGDRDQGKRPEMGAIVEQYADQMLVTSDNPRTENPDAIIDAIVSGVCQSDAVQRIVDRKQAIAQAIQSAGENDIVLVAGKGHESYQQIGVERLPFSDREHAWFALQAYQT